MLRASVLIHVSRGWVLPFLLLSILQDMSALDGDGGMLKDYSGNVATRDIVQFVPFSKYSGVSTREILA